MVYADPFFRDNAASRLDARILVGTNRQADELVTRFRGQLGRVRARSEANCQQFALVDKLKEREYPERVRSLVCKSCPFQEACRSADGEYLNQFSQDRVLVATTHFLNSPDFLGDARLVLMVEPNLAAYIPRTSRPDGQWSC